MSDNAATPECISCPHCGGANVITPVSVVRHDDAENIEALFRGALNRTECQRCSKEFLFETPIVYRDDLGRRLIYFLPASMCPDPAVATKQLDELIELIFADFDEEDRPACTLTAARSAFIEKIAIHRAGLDDRLVEYVKYQLFQHSEGLDHHKHELLYDFANSTGEKLSFVCFDRKNRKATYAMEFERPDYDELATWFLGEGVSHLQRLFPSYWAQVDDLFID